MLNWADALDGVALAPGASRMVTVTFTGREDTTPLDNGEVLNHAIGFNVEADPDGPGGIPAAVAVPDEKESSAGVAIRQPTGVIISDFLARPERGQVRITWTTLTEANILGFNVLRGLSRVGGFQQINAQLILAQHSGTTEGARYTFEDREPLPGGVSHYRLEVIRLDGRSQVVGGDTVTLPGSRFYLPMMGF